MLRELISALLLLLTLCESRQHCDPNVEKQVIDSLNRAYAYTNQVIDRVALQSDGVDSLTRDLWVNVEPPRFVRTRQTMGSRGCLALSTEPLSNWVAKLEFVRSLSLPGGQIKQTTERVISAVSLQLERLSELYVMAPYNTSEIGLSRDERRLKREFRKHTRVLHPQAFEYAIGTNASLELGTHTRNASWVLPFPETKELWPEFSDMDSLLWLLYTRSAVPCNQAHLEFSGSDFFAINVTRVDLELSLGAYNATLGINGFEQLRFYCSHGEKYLVITQRPVSTISLVQLYDAQTAAAQNFSVVTGPWQLVLSLRMRQVMELMATLGWIHPDPNSSSMLFEKRTWLPLLVDLHKCRQRRAVPHQSRLRRYSDDQAVQIAAFASGREVTEKYMQTFGLGKDYLFKKLHRLQA